MKNKLRAVAMTLLWGASAGTVLAQGSVFKDEFEEKVGDWVAVGPHAKLSVTTEAGKAKAGKGALEFTYRIGGKPDEQKPAPMSAFDVLLRPTPNGALAKMKSLRFHVKADSETPLAIVLAEKGEGRYIAMAWIPKGEWQEVILSPDDFTLTTDKDDPKDPDGKLDMDKVENISIVDPLSIFAPALSESGAGGFSDAGLHLGAHTLWIDDFTASEQAAPARDKTAGTIDAFDRPLLSWIAIGEVQMKREKEAPTKTAALRADYVQGDGKYVVIVKNLYGLTGDATKDDFVLDMAAAKSSRIIITLEEKNGSHYSTTLAVPGDADPIHRVLALSQFALSEGPNDENGKLDMDQIKSLTFTDVTGAFGIAKQKNTLWIGPVRVQKK